MARAAGPAQPIKYGEQEEKFISQDEDTSLLNASQDLTRNRTCTIAFLSSSEVRSIGKTIQFSEIKNTTEGERIPGFPLFDGAFLFESNKESGVEQGFFAIRVDNELCELIKDLKRDHLQNGRATLQFNILLSHEISDIDSLITYLNDAKEKKADEELALIIDLVHENEKQYPTKKWMIKYDHTFPTWETVNSLSEFVAYIAYNLFGSIAPKIEYLSHSKSAKKYSESPILGSLYLHSYHLAKLKKTSKKNLDIHLENIALTLSKSVGLNTPRAETILSTFPDSTPRTLLASEFIDDLHTTTNEAFGSNRDEKYLAEKIDDFGGCAYFKQFSAIKKSFSELKKFIEEYIQNTKLRNLNSHQQEILIQFINNFNKFKNDFEQLIQIIKNNGDYNEYCLKKKDISTYIQNISKNIQFSDIKDNKKFVAFQSCFHTFTIEINNKNAFNNASTEIMHFETLFNETGSYKFPTLIDEKQQEGQNSENIRYFNPAIPAYSPIFFVLALIQGDNDKHEGNFGFIIDRDQKTSAQFDTTFRSDGSEIIKTLDSSFRYDHSLGYKNLSIFTAKTPTELMAGVFTLYLMTPEEDLKQVFSKKEINLIKEIIDQYKENDSEFKEISAKMSENKQDSHLIIQNAFQSEIDKINEKIKKLKRELAKIETTEDRSNIIKKMITEYEYYISDLEEKKKNTVQNALSILRTFHEAMLEDYYTNVLRNNLELFSSDTTNISEGQEITNPRTGQKQILKARLPHLIHKPTFEPHWTWKTTLLTLFIIGICPFLQYVGVALPAITFSIASSLPLIGTISLSITLGLAIPFIGFAIAVIGFGTYYAYKKLTAPKKISWVSTKNSNGEISLTTQSLSETETLTLYDKLRSQIKNKELKAKINPFDNKITIEKLNRQEIQELVKVNKELSECGDMSELQIILAKKTENPNDHQQTDNKSLQIPEYPHNPVNTRQSSHYRSPSRSPSIRFARRSSSTADNYEQPPVARSLPDSSSGAFFSGIKGLPVGTSPSLTTAAVASLEEATISQIPAPAAAIAAVRVQDVPQHTPAAAKSEARLKAEAEAKAAEEARLKAAEEDARRKAEAKEQAVESKAQSAEVFHAEVKEQAVEAKVQSAEVLPAVYPERDREPSSEIKSQPTQRGDEAVQIAVPTKNKLQQNLRHLSDLSETDYKTTIARLGLFSDARQQAKAAAAELPPLAAPIPIPAAAVAFR